MRIERLLVRTLSALLAGGALLALSSGGARAQALWSLTLDTPNPSVVAGSGGSVVYTGTIKNTGSGPDLNLFGDSLTTSHWDSSLSLAEASGFTDFLNNNGLIGPGASYTGALFTVTYSALTAASGSTHYNGSFLVQTDGQPGSLGTPFTLAVTGGSIVSGGTAPEPSSLLLLSLAGGMGVTIQRVLGRRRTGQ